MTLANIKSRLPDFLTSDLYLDPDDTSQTGDENNLTEYSSIGPNNNEDTVVYEYSQGAHHFRFLRQVSPDILLVHQSKLVGFYLKLGSTDEIDVISRDLKDIFLLDVNMKV